MALGRGLERARAPLSAIADPAMDIACPAYAEPKRIPWLRIMRGTLVPSLSAVGASGALAGSPLLCSHSSSKG